MTICGAQGADKDSIPGVSESVDAVEVCRPSHHDDHYTDVRQPRHHVSTYCHQPSRQTRTADHIPRVQSPCGAVLDVRLKITTGWVERRPRTTTSASAPPPSLHVTAKNVSTQRRHHLHVDDDCFPLMHTGSWTGTCIDHTVTCYNSNLNSRRRRRKFICCNEHNIIYYDIETHGGLPERRKPIKCWPPY